MEYFQLPCRDLRNNHQLLKRHLIMPMRNKSAFGLHKDFHIPRYIISQNHLQVPHVFVFLKYKLQQFHNIPSPFFKKLEAGERTYKPIERPITQRTPVHSITEAIDFHMAQKHTCITIRRIHVQCLSVFVLGHQVKSLNEGSMGTRKICWMENIFGQVHRIPSCFKFLRYCIAVAGLVNSAPRTTEWEATAVPQW